MPCDKVPCPLCREEVSRNKLGAHLLSKKHYDAIKDINAKNLEKWKASADYLSNLPAHPNYPDLPLVKTKNGYDFYCCFGCKSAWVNMPYDHHASSKKCIQTHARALHSLSGVVSEPDRVQTLEKELQELRKKLSDTTSGKVVEVSGDEELKSKYDELVSEKEQADEENEELLAQNSQLRGILQDLLGDAYPKKSPNFKELIFELKEIVKAKKETPVTKEEPKEPPKKEKSAALKFLLEQPLGTEWNDKIDKAIGSLSHEEMREYNQFMNAAHARPAVAVAAPKAPPFVPPQPIAENSILGTARLLTTTKMKAKTVGAPSVAPRPLGAYHQ